LGYVDNADKLKISPHKFDAAAVAELIIRIMTTHPQQTSTTMPVSLTNNAPGKTDNISKASTSNGAGTGAGRVNRLAQLQNSAAAVRTKTAAGATSDITAPPTIDGAATTTTNRTTATTPSGSGGTNSGSTSSSDGDSGDSGGSGPSTLVRGEAILVFLSGIQAIEQVNKALRQRSIMQKFNAQVRFFFGVSFRLPGYSASGCSCLYALRTFIIFFLPWYSHGGTGVHSTRHARIRAAKARFPAHISRRMENSACYKYRYRCCLCGPVKCTLVLLSFIFYTMLSSGNINHSGRRNPCGGQWVRKRDAF
jgi:hypothetical protein